MKRKRLLLNVKLVGAILLWEIVKQLCRFTKNVCRLTEMINLIVTFED